MMIYKKQVLRTHRIGCIVGHELGDNCRPVSAPERDVNTPVVVVHIGGRKCRCRRSKPSFACR